MKLLIENEKVELWCRGRSLLLFSEEESPIYLGKGKESVDMYRGNFKIEDYLEERIHLLPERVEEQGEGACLYFRDGTELALSLSEDRKEARLRFRASGNYNRFWIRFAAEKQEHVYGCGEQMSYFDLRGRHFPLWTSEPGVGRDKTSYVTWRSDVENKGGGDYYNTNFPAPTFVSSEKYFVDVKSTAYSDFDFRHEDFHELQFWEIPAELSIAEAETWQELMLRIRNHFGVQPALPGWVRDGLIIGLQGGSERVNRILETLQKHHVRLAGLWCQDWCGKRITSFGKRLQWDWHYEPEMYPALPKQIEEWHAQGLKFLAYINPYLVEGGRLFREGVEKDVFARRKDGSIYLVDFGEFDCGVVDLSKPSANAWFRSVISKYSIEIGIDGWMADFGEYLPTDDIVLDSGKPAMIEHNFWPVRWAKCNYEAVKDAGKLGEILYFLRAGGTGTQRYAAMLWAGDQSVDFSRHDGIGTVISAALSVGICGVGYSHSDIGGYTSLFDNVRTEELFLRWAEMAVFTAMMRTHEGNRPESNFQCYDSVSCMESLARLTQIYTDLAPYTKTLDEEYQNTGMPMQRPLFFYYEKEERTLTEQFSYLFGRDILVSPVVEEKAASKRVFLPEDRWIHLWSGEEYSGGEHKIASPLGYPPVFYRRESPFGILFGEIQRKYGIC